ncbi:hypothetical protein C8259_01250 [Nocardia nova]|uniref:Uncharacterized protein n=2 Tax=Nocardiaceae TaxID=85025 RepID=A0A2T2ZE21_9NOCA|nr:hypothetical protein C8259_01250 [Nocardia nova]
MVRAHESSGLPPREFVHKLYEVMGAEPFVEAGQESRALHQWEQGQTVVPDDVITAAAVLLPTQEGQNQRWRSHPERDRAGRADLPVGPVSIDEQAEAIDRADREFKRNVMVRAREASGLKRQPFARQLYEAMDAGPANGKEWRDVQQWESGWLEPSNEAVAAASGLIPTRPDGRGRDWGPAPTRPGIVDLDAMQDATERTGVTKLPRPQMVSTRPTQTPHVVREMARPVFPAAAGIERPAGWELAR